MTTALIKRRAERGRPRNDEAKPSQKKITVYITRDPQGIKLFRTKPKLSVVGVWEGAAVPGTKVMDTRVFVTKFRNATLPTRGGVVGSTMIL